MPTALVGVGLYACKKVYDKHCKARPLSNSENRQYLCQATLNNLLAILVHGVYSRDRTAVDLPAWIQGQVEEDSLVDLYTKEYWGRMREISEQEEEKVGLMHYLRREPDDLANGNHNRYRLVIALRGTKLTSLRDIVDDIKIAHNTLHCSSRYKATQLLIEKILTTFHSSYNGSTSEVCITGHSLGAAIALSIGKDLAKDKSKRYAVHCFNPPLVTVLMLIQKLLHYDKFKARLSKYELAEPLLHVGGITKQVGKLVLAKILFGEHGKLEEEFEHFCGLSEWKPVLYVNRRDAICKEYLRFYEWKNRAGVHVGLPIHMQSLVSRILTLKGPSTPQWAAQNWILASFGLGQHE